jgi:Protein of unknown function (DUF1569)
MKETLADSVLRAAIVARVQRLRPDSPRQWGRMTPHQAVCHLSDSFKSMMTPTPITSTATPFSRTVVRWIALNAPMKWPHGLKTMPEVDQEVGGTKPVEFARDRLELERLIEQFAAHHDFQAHPMFGRMTARDWLRWGWRHTDHHLRQFAA